MRTAVVAEGDRDFPTVLVLDPVDAGEAGELPMTWRDLARRRQIVWCRLPVTEALPRAGLLLADPDALGRPIDVVVSGRVRENVRSLVTRNAGSLRALLLVDPDPDQREHDVTGVSVRAVGHAEPSRSLSRTDVRADIEAALEALDAEGCLPRSSHTTGAGA